jgi:carboxypeptidase family protein/TonB-dependent receptor-like protein
MAKRLGRWTIGAAFILILLASQPAWAQTTASITGRVSDQAGAVLPGVTVTVINMATGATRDAITNAEGTYTVPALIAGTYSVKAELSGFSAAVRENIELLTGQTLSVDSQMSLAGIQENLTVTGQSPLVETTQSTLSASIRQSEVVQIPMINRSMAALMNLLPGAREVGGAVSAHGNAQTYVSFSGGSGQNYNMLVDGIDNKEDHCGGASIVYSLEGIQEFRTISTGASAEYGKGTTTILLATKSGGNQVHGSIAAYGRNQDIMAIDYFSKPENGGTGKPPFSRYQYGGSLGGPVVKDRAWFFGSIERTQQQYTVVRPDRITNELRYLVPLNIGVSATPTIPQPSRDLMSQFKINTNLNHDNSVFVRYASEYGYVDNDFIGTSAALLDYSNGVMDHNRQKLWNVSPGWTWVMNPTTINQLTAQYITWTHDQSYPDCNLPGLNACLSQRLTFPSGYSTGPIHAFPKWYNFEQKYELKDDFSKQVSQHSFKTGVDYTAMPVYGGVFGSGSPGSILFFDDPSVIATNSNGKYPQGFQTPGIVRTITVFSQPIGDYGSDGNWSLGLYGQDDFKASPRLTLNLGLRWDVYEFMNQPNLAKNRMYQVLQAIGSPYGQLPKTDRNNFSPRIGMAWDLTGDGTNIIRSSYGLYYVQQIKNTYYQRNYLEKPTIFFSTLVADPTFGCTFNATTCPLGNFVYGQSPLPPTPLNPTFFPAGQRTVGYWYDPNLQDAQTQKFHAGYSHIFPHETAISADYTHVLLQHGWRNLDINPLINGVRPLAADFQRVYGDPNLIGVINIASSINRGLYDELAVHFERRFSLTTSLQTNYTLAWARGMGGAIDGALRNASASPQVASASGGDIYAPYEFGPTAYDERHRITVAGVFNLPFGFDASPSLTAASARPYTQINGANPSGDGSLQVKNADGTPAGIGNARGLPLFNVNARVTKNFSLGKVRKGSVFIEMYNLTNRANFGNALGTNAAAPATYNKPVGYLGGIGAVSTIPNSFQMQFGARYSF